MDRSTIEGDPHTVLEGMIIGGYAIGAKQGFVYIRAEYPLAIKRLEMAIAAAREARLPGQEHLRHRLGLRHRDPAGRRRLRVRRGDRPDRVHRGRRAACRGPGRPTRRSSGLWGKPTVINNVETLANVPVVILDGPEWFASIGTEKSKGTKVFALAGKVCNTGLVEVPMGTTLREVVYDVGGGIPDGKTFKAVQTGGPAGGCLPESFLDTPVDYESLTAAGSHDGQRRHDRHGRGLLHGGRGPVLPGLHPGRVVRQVHRPAARAPSACWRSSTASWPAQGVEGDVEKLLRLGDTIKRASLCGLGQSAPNPVLSTITHFRDEYDAHIRDKRCPAGSARSCSTYSIVPDEVHRLRRLQAELPGELHQPAAKKEVHVIDTSRCITCGQCFDVCKFDAVNKE